MADGRELPKISPEDRRRWEEQALTLAWVKGLNKLTPEQRARVLAIDEERVARGELPWLEHVSGGGLRPGSEGGPAESC